MKRMLIAGSIAALALLGSPGAAQADPADASCFGGVHKRVNTGDLGALLMIDNVGQLVKTEGGPGKNAIAASVCGG